MTDTGRHGLPAAGPHDEQQPGPEDLRLMEYLDGRLPPAEAALVEAWLERDPRARRLAQQHRRAWALLGELDPPVEADGSQLFRHATLRRARREGRARAAAGGRRTLALLAAALLVAVTHFAVRDEPSSWARLSAEERDIVQNLDLLEHLEMLDRYGEQLDLAVDFEIMRAFDGELPETGR